MNTFSAEQMQALSQAVVQHMDDWQISPEQMLELLGVSDRIKTRQLNALRMGSKALPNETEVLQRIDHIVGIADALRTTFPFSSQMRHLWLQKPHRRFHKLTPLTVMLSEGLNGLQKVRIEVDCSYGYAINDALYAAKQQS